MYNARGNGIYADRNSALKKTLAMIGAATIVVVAVVVTVAVLVGGSSEDEVPIVKRVSKLLAESPVIDGHNDFPWNLRNIVYNDLDRVNFSEDLSKDPVWGPNNGSHTDIPRLRKGNVGGQFWVAYTSCSSQYKDSVEQTLEQIDTIRRLALKYSDDLQFATSADEIEDAIKNKKIASLIAVEGGHSMQFSLGILRMLYALGARYMTLTHSCNTPWADASPVDAVNATLQPESEGLSTFGLEVIEEMNRLGMMVDLSHVSQATMKAALNHTKAPVIFSHSSAWAICNHHRNVPDDVLQMVKETNSIVMVNFYSRFVKCDGDNATIDDVVEHINHIRNITGPDHIGVGGDFDGVDEVPVGLEDVSKYPALFEALLRSGGWTDEDLQKVSQGNLLRVFRDVEKVRDSYVTRPPIEDTLKQEDLDEHHVNTTCITAKFEKLTPEERRVRRFIAEEQSSVAEL